MSKKPLILAGMIGLAALTAGVFACDTYVTGGRGYTSVRDTVWTALDWAKFWERSANESGGGN